MVTDEVGNTTSATIDYHVLAPWRITDPNGTAQAVDYDPLGVTHRTSRYGSSLDASANLVSHGFGALTLGQALPSFTAALADPEAELGTAESLFLYEYPAGGQPMRSLALAAEQLVDRGPDAGSAAARAHVEPGLALVDDGLGGLIEAQSTDRWRISGHVAFDAKQQPR